LNIPGEAIAAANDGVNAFNRAYHSSFFYIRFVLLLPLRRNRARYLLLRNLKPLEKKGDEFLLRTRFSFRHVSLRDIKILYYDLYNIKIKQLKDEEIF